ncbi:MAG: IS200/IS605 family transposase [Geobacteraceae bacterium]
MANTYTALHYHIVFSTKNREPWLTPDKESRIWEYLGGIARANGMKALKVGGCDDHLHILLALPTTMTVSKAVQLLKGASSRWIHETDNDMMAFAWQDGYGAFTAGISQISDTIQYIEGQREHHRTKSFQEEYIHFLRKHGVEYDERYVWG